MLSTTLDAVLCPNLSCCWLLGYYFVTAFYCFDCSIFKRNHIEFLLFTSFTVVQACLGLQALFATMCLLVWWLCRSTAYAGCLVIVRILWWPVVPVTISYQSISLLCNKANENAYVCRRPSVLLSLTVRPRLSSIPLCRAQCAILPTSLLWYLLFQFLSLWNFVVHLSHFASVSLKGCF